mgnify:CR=1 FL=1
MTREDIARSLKPIQWTYRHEFSRYAATFGVGDRSLRLKISPVLGAHPESYLTIFRNEELIGEGYKKIHKNLDEAMKEARSYLIKEVCDLFDLEEE